MTNGTYHTWFSASSPLLITVLRSHFIVFLIFSVLAVGFAWVVYGPQSLVEGVLHNVFSHLNDTLPLRIKPIIRMLTRATSTSQFSSSSHLQYPRLHLPLSPLIPFFLLLSPGNMITPMVVSCPPDLWITCLCPVLTHICSISFTVGRYTVNSCCSHDCYSHHSAS